MYLHVTRRVRGYDWRSFIVRRTYFHTPVYVCVFVYMTFIPGFVIFEGLLVTRTVDWGFCRERRNFRRIYKIFAKAPKQTHPAYNARGVSYHKDKYMYADCNFIKYVYI